VIGYRLGRTLAILALSAAPLNAAGGQEPSIPPSKRIKVVCDAFRGQMSDLTKMSSVISNPEEATGATQLATTAELNLERCLSVHSLLFAYELLAPGRDKSKVGEWVAFRMDQYAVLKTDLQYSREMITLTKLPGLAREAKSLRDRLSTFAELCATLKPK